MIASSFAIVAIETLDLDASPEKEALERRLVARVPSSRASLRVPSIRRLPVRLGRPVAGLRKGVDYVWRNWSPDGRFVYAWDPTQLPFRVFRVELATGRRDP